MLYQYEIKTELDQYYCVCIPMESDGSYDMDNAVTVGPYDDTESAISGALVHYVLVGLAQ